MSQNQQELNEIQKKIALGFDVEAFFNSDLGKYLLGRAADEAINAMNELKDIDPTLTERIRTLQGIIARSEKFELWLQEALIVGQSSEEQLDQMSRNE